MTGSAFILHGDNWSCTNIATFRETHTPVFANEGDIIPTHTVKGYQVTCEALFHANSRIHVGDACEIVFKSDSDDGLRGFIGEMQHIGEKISTIKISTKTERIKEILSNITSKIN